jgi:hypothetical protein
METFVLESHRVLKSVISRISKFSAFIQSGVQPASLTINCREDITKLRESTRYKYSTGRNMLGVRILLEDWIHGLEIGHVMQLNPILASELINP